MDRPPERTWTTQYFCSQVGDENQMLKRTIAELKVEADNNN